MQKNSFIILFISQLLFSQNEKLIIGKLMSKEQVPQNVHIINLVSEKETISNANGEFKILAKENDLLVFSSKNFNYERKIIETTDYNNGEIVVNLIEKIEELEEVKIVNYPSINAVSLGILSKPAKQYTPIEGKLKAARSFDFAFIDGFMPGFQISINPIVNSINGKITSLIKELKIERKELLIKNLEDSFSPSFYIKDLRLKEDQVKAFHFYCAEDEEFASILKSNNKTATKIKMHAMAAKFKKLNETN